MKTTKKRILKINWDDFAVPTHITDEQVTNCLEVLSQLIPCDYNGNIKSGDGIKYSYESSITIEPGEDETAETAEELDF